MPTKAKSSPVPAQRPTTERSDEHHPWDRAWKRALDERSHEVLSALCRLDVGDAKVARGPDEHERGPHQLRTDRVYVAQHDSGRADVIHFEIQLHQEKGFNRRLVAYWSQLDRLYPDRATHELRQFVILPTGARGITGEYRRGGMSLSYRVLDIPKIPAQELLDGPLPTLAFWSSPEPTELVDRVVDRIEAIPELEARSAVANLGMLAEERVASRFARALRSRNMTNVLENTDIGREIEQRGEKRGEQRGEKRGEQRGEQQGSRKILTALITNKFGPDAASPELVATLSSLDPNQAIAAITTSATADELRARL